MVVGASEVTLRFCDFCRSLLRRNKGRRHWLDHATRMHAFGGGTGEANDELWMNYALLGVMKCHNGGVSLTRLFADSSRFRVVFVCTGNICRSPMAEAVTKRIAKRAGLEDRILIASAGIGDFHVGETADPRTDRALTNTGFDLGDHRAKQIQPDWFDVFDVIIALDRSQERALKVMAPEHLRSRVKLLMEFEPDASTPDVPDPYYSDESFFAEVLQQIESACESFFRQIEPALRSPSSTPRPPEQQPLECS